MNSLSLTAVACLAFACAQPVETQPVETEPMTTPEAENADVTATEVATLGAGCFWCVEAVLEQFDGIESVTSGYMGGEIDNPSYKAICTGKTGHAEVVQVRFVPSVISYAEVLDLFWRLHNPTTLDRQGSDVGPQYRSAIFVHSDEQRAAAESSLKAADASGSFSAPIVTEITDATTFWPAEEYHQDYYRQNKSQGYCQVVIRPKLNKLGLEE